MTNTTVYQKPFSHACAVRMTDKAAAMLRNKAHENSLLENCDISVSDVIRAALIAKYGEEYRKSLEG